MGALRESVISVLSTKEDRDITLEYFMAGSQMNLSREAGSPQIHFKANWVHRDVHTTVGMYGSIAASSGLNLLFM